MNGIELRRWIMVTVVGANHQAILTCIAQDVGQIVRVLAGHPHVISSKGGVGWKRLALAPETVSEIVQNVGHPLRADLNESPTNGREFFGDLFFKKRVTCADDRQLELGKRRVVVEEVMMDKAAIGRMDEDR